VTDIAPLGDFNLPKAAPGDRICDAVVSYGRPDRLLPGPTHDRFTGKSNVFDFDRALFQTCGRRGRQSSS
jgi:hypothetical protein